MDRGRIGVFAALALGLAALAACNVVATKAPLFTAADASPLKLRDGVWAPVDDGCRFDARAPVDVWPACAEPVLVRDGAFLSWQADSKNWRSDETGKVLIAAGDPMILQARDTPANSEPVYVYAGLTAKTDAQGRIVAIRAWPVLCGPPPPQGKGGATQGLTKAPFAGLTLDPEAQVCTTRDPEVLRAAAKASRALAAASLRPLRWVRDGER